MAHPAVRAALRTLPPFGRVSALHGHSDEGGAEERVYALLKRLGDVPLFPLLHLSPRAEGRAVEVQRYISERQTVERKEEIEQIRAVRSMHAAAQVRGGSEGSEGSESEGEESEREDSEEQKHASRLLGNLRQVCAELTEVHNKLYGHNAMNEPLRKRLTELETRGRRMITEVEAAVTAPGIPTGQVRMTREACQMMEIILDATRGAALPIQV